MNRCVSKATRTRPEQNACADVLMRQTRQTCIHMLYNTIPPLHVTTRPCPCPACPQHKVPCLPPACQGSGRTHSPSCRPFDLDSGTAKRRPYRRRPPLGLESGGSRLLVSVCEAMLCPCLNALWLSDPRAAASGDQSGLRPPEAATR